MADLRSLAFSVGFKGNTGAVVAMDSAVDKLKDRMGQVSNRTTVATSTFENMNARSSSLINTLKGVGGAIAGAFAIDKIIDFGKSSIESAGSAKAIASQFTQTFGELEPVAKTAIDDMAGQFGMVPERLTPAMSQMTSMFKGLGMDTTTAMAEATSAVTMSADAAAFYDKSFADANSALTSFVKGNYEGGEAIGLFANDTQLATFAVSQGLVAATKDWSGLDEATKQATRLDYAQNMQQLAGATGQAARESDGYENQLGNIQQAWSNFLAIVGGPVLGGVVNIMKDITSGLKTAGEKVIFLQDGFNGLGDPEALSGLDADLYNVGERVAGIVDGFVTVAGKVGDFINATGGIDGVIQKIEILAGGFIAIKSAMAISGVIAGVSAAYGVLTGVMGALSIANLVSAGETVMLTGMYAAEAIAMGVTSVATGAWTAAQWLLNAALSANPIGIIIVAIAALVGGIVWLWNTNEGFRNAVITIWTAVSGFLIQLWNNIVSGLQQAGQSIGEIWDGIVNGFQAAVTGIQTAWGVVVGFFQGIWAGIVAVFNAVVGFFVGIYTAEWNGIMAVWNGAVSFFGGIVSGIAGVFSGVSGAITGAFDGALTFLSELPSRFLEWGADMVQGLIDGIRGAIGAVGDAVQAVADKITSFLHFSRPDVGPLHYYETWMPDMMHGLASGITSNIGLIKNAVSGVSSEMSMNLNGNVNYEPNTIALRQTASVEKSVKGNVTSGNNAPVTFKTEIHISVGNGANVNEIVDTAADAWEEKMERYIKKLYLRNPAVTA